MRWLRRGDYSPHRRAWHHRLRDDYGGWDRRGRRAGKSLLCSRRCRWDDGSHRRAWHHWLRDDYGGWDRRDGRRWCLLADHRRDESVQYGLLALDDCLEADSDRRLYLVNQRLLRVERVGERRSQLGLQLLHQRKLRAERLIDGILKCADQFTSDCLLLGQRALGILDRIRPVIGDGE